MKLTNNTILITGGTSGIGLELGKALLQKGNTVILLGRNEELNELAGKGFETVQCDISNPEAIEKTSIYLQNHYPQLNMLFNNAGVQYNYDFTDGINPDKISQEININVSGQILLTQLLIPLLSSSENSFIVNTTSGLGAFPKTDGLVYSATKAAMRNFTIGLRLLLQKTSIKVLEFIPPVTNTGMTRGRDESKMSAYELVQKILPQLQKGRRIMTIPKMRLFLWIAFLLPGLAHKILSKA